MGIYIPGMEMPTGHTTIRIYADGTVEHEHTERKLGTAIPVPDHGWYIDAADYATPDDYDFLVQYEPPQPQTNADRIRQMSDEDLANLLNDVQGEAYLIGFLDRGKSAFTPNGKSWIDWLKAPADKEGEE